MAVAVLLLIFPKPRSHIIALLEGSSTYKSKSLTFLLLTIRREGLRAKTNQGTPHRNCHMSKLFALCGVAVNSLRPCTGLRAIPWSYWWPALSLLYTLFRSKFGPFKIGCLDSTKQVMFSIFTIMLAGFRSWCIMPLSWMYAAPWAAVYRTKPSYFLDLYIGIDSKQVYINNFLLCSLPIWVTFYTKMCYSNNY